MQTRDDGPGLHPISLSRTLHCRAHTSMLCLTLAPSCASLAVLHWRVPSLQSTPAHWLHTCGVSTTAGGGDNDVVQVIDLTEDEEHDVIDVETFEVEVLLVRVIKPDPDAPPRATTSTGGVFLADGAFIKPDPDEALAPQ